MDKVASPFAAFMPNQENKLIAFKANALAEKVFEIIKKDASFNFSEDYFSDYNFLDYVYDFGRENPVVCLEVLSDALKHNWNKTGNRIFGFGKDMHNYLVSRISVAPEGDFKKELQKLCKELQENYCKPFLEAKNKGLLKQPHKGAPYYEMVEYDYKLFAYDRALFMKLLQENIDWNV